MSEIEGEQAVVCCRSSLQEARINAMATALKARLWHSPMRNEPIAMQVLVWSIYICAVPRPHSPSLRLNFYATATQGFTMLVSGLVDCCCGALWSSSFLAVY